MDRQKAMNVHFFGKTEASDFKHGWPKQRVKINEVFANKVMDLGIRVSPPGVKRFTMAITPLLRRSHVTDGCVEPDKPVVSRTIRNLKAKIRCGPRDIPIP